MAASSTSLEQAILETYASEGASNTNEFLLTFDAADFRRKEPLQEISASDPACLQTSWASLTRTQRKRLGFQSSVTLPGAHISTLGSLQAACSAMARLTTLDLQGNQLSLSHLLQILFELPQLETLDMGKNKLHGTLPKQANVSPSSLRTLSLNASGVAPVTAGALMQQLPKLQQLHVCDNDWAEVLPCVAAAVDAVPIRRLFLGGNPLSSLCDSLSAVAAWKHLQLLDMAGTAFSTASTYTQLAACALPPSLDALGVDECALGSWAEVAAVGALRVPSLRLRRIPALQHIVETPTPGHVAAAASGVDDGVSTGARGLYLPRAEACGAQGSEALLRQITVALLPHACTLNGSAVSSSERDAAERFSVRYFRRWGGGELAAGGVSEQQAEEAGLLGEMWQPPGMQALLSKHGNLGPLAVVDLGAPDSVTLEVQYIWDSSSGGSVGLPRSGLMEVGLKQTIGQLKQQLSLPLKGVAGAGVSSVVYVDSALAERGGGQVGEEALNFNSLQVSTLRPTEQDRLRVFVSRSA